MRLIETKTGRFAEFFDLSKIPPYAILSHTWDPPPIGEQSYQDVVKIQERYGVGPNQPSPSSNSPSDSKSDQSITLYNAHRRRTQKTTIRIPFVHKQSIWDEKSGLSEKIRKACEVARLEGYRYIWIDSSCIDKTSSSELSEAINSMFKWYCGAQVCYAFLSDVSSPHSTEDLTVEGSSFRKSRWFTRSWTLQELIAPQEVVFFSREWRGLGTKHSLAGPIQEITFIDRGILTHEKALVDTSVAERMRWAAGRQATRVEDEAYSLLGIFGLNMPTLYGEGAYAFRRLQEEILQRIPDQSLFAWGSVSLPIPQEPFEIRVGVEDFQSPFAPSPHSFGRDSRCPIISVPGRYALGIPNPEYTPTPYGIRTPLRLLPLTALNPGISVIGTRSGDVGEWCLAILGCGYDNETDKGRVLGRLCYLTPSNFRLPMDESDVEFLHTPMWISLPNQLNQESRHNALLFSIPVDETTNMELKTRTVHLPHPGPTLFPIQRQIETEQSHGPLEITLSPWARDHLQTRGYTIENVRIPTTPVHHLTSLVFEFAIYNVSLRLDAYIQFRHLLVDRHSNVKALVLQARIWVLSESLPFNNFMGYILDDSDHLNSSGDIWTRATLQTPPFASITWVDETPWAMTLPPQSVNIATITGDRPDVTLRFALGLTEPSHYSLQLAAHDVAVAPWDLPQTLPLPTVIEGPHTEFALILPGSVRRSLEGKGYAMNMDLRFVAHLKGPDTSTGNLDGSYSLVISNAVSGFTIYVKYFYVLRTREDMDGIQELIVAARVTLELSSTLTVGSSSESGTHWQDGPYVAVWRDTTPTWRWSQEEVQIVLTTPSGHSTLMLYLGLDLAWRNEYYVHARIQCNPDRADNHDEYATYSGTLDGTHTRIALTLPGHVKRALQIGGYEVQFNTLDLDNDHLDHCRLTLSNATFTILIEYSHTLSTDSNGKQELTFRACASASSDALHGTSGAVAQDGNQVVEWDAWNPEAGAWRRQLPTKDITLTLPRGTRVTLRLGFYLVWFSEYCLTVQVVPSGNAISRATV